MLFTFWLKMMIETMSGIRKKFTVKATLAILPKMERGLVSIETFDNFRFEHFQLIRLD